jgi:1-acyl-sn-glycerol-3-phosphate acyltransferase
MSVIIKADGCATSARAGDDSVNVLRPISLRDVLAFPLPAMEGKPISRLVCRALVMLGQKVGVTIEGLNHVRSIPDPFILAVNHTHKLEALLLPALLAFHRSGKQVHFMVDWNFLLYPGLATLIRLNRPIIVTRKPAKPAWLNIFRPLYKSSSPPFVLARRNLEAGRSVGIYPEGTRNPSPHTLMRGLRGTARLSLETGAPVVPAGIRFTSANTSEFSPFHVSFGAPLHPPADDKDVVHWHERIMRELALLSGKSWERSNPRTKYELRNPSLAC